MFQEDERHQSRHAGLVDSRTPSQAPDSKQDHTKLLGERGIKSKHTARDHLLSVLATDAHCEAAHFSTPNSKCCKCCTSRCLLTYRIIFFIPCFTIACLNTFADPLGDIYYESEWGFLMSTFSILFSICAHCTKWCQTTAMLTSEISMAFNIIITIIFWGILVPQIYQAIIHPPDPPVPQPPCQYTNFLKFECTGSWMLFELAFVHSAPMINSVVEILSTEMVFLKRDAKWAFLAGIIYMFCDYWGSKFVLKAPIYNIPWLNWEDPQWHSWLGYGAQAPVLAAIVWVIAVYTQKRRGFKNGHWIKKGVTDEDEDKQDSEIGLNASKDTSKLAGNLMM